MLHNLQQVEEELQSCDALIAPPVPPRPSPVAAAAAADDDDGDGDLYLELHPGEGEGEDLYEFSDVVQPMRQQRHVLPGQMSMPESSLPPAVVPRKQSCPTELSIRREARPLPQTPEETGEPTDSTRIKSTYKPPVAARKK